MISVECGQKIPITDEVDLASSAIDHLGDENYSFYKDRSPVLFGSCPVSEPGASAFIILTSRTLRCRDLKPLEHDVAAIKAKLSGDTYSCKKHGTPECPLQQQRPL